MRLGLIADNLLERAALAAGIVPPAIFECWFGLMLTRTVMAATRLDVFEALADGPLASEEVAARCKTHPQATEKLLNALVGLRCITVKRKRYSLARSLRAWALKNSKSSFRGQVLMHYLEWRWWEHCEDYIRTGKPLAMHETLADDDWSVYQEGMRSGIEMPAKWVARHLPLRRDAEQMLDIGGSHGYFSVAICRRFPRLRSVILDLPNAVQHAAPILAREKLADRVVHQVGDARSDSLGFERYDLVFLSAIVHHFDDATNRQLMARIARALRPGGIVAVWEPMRQSTGGRIRQIGGLFDLFFAMLSASGTWSPDEIADWMTQAGLTPDKPRSPRLMPDLALHVGHRTN